MRNRPRILGQLLVGSTELDPETLRDALAQQSSTRLRIGETLVRLGAVTTEHVACALGTQLGLRYTPGPLSPTRDALRAAAAWGRARRKFLRPMAYVVGLAFAEVVIEAETTIFEETCDRRPFVEQIAAAPGRAAPGRLLKRPIRLSPPRELIRSITSTHVRSGAMR